MALDGIGGVRPGQPPVGAPAPVGDIALTNAQALGAKLRSGEIISARVGADLGGGNVSLTVRGQTVVATSQLPLHTDSIVRLMVQSAGDQPVLRILGSPSSDLANLSSPAARASALGLASTPLVAVALSAFEAAGAPLDAARLRDAVAQLQRAPAADIPQRAQALALLAQAGLPTTPPFVALAQRSATGVLPNPAAAVADLQRAAQAVPSTGVAGGPSTTTATALSAAPGSATNVGGSLPTGPSTALRVAPANATPLPLAAGTTQVAGAQAPVASGPVPGTSVPVAGAGGPALVTTVSLPGATSQPPALVGQVPVPGGQLAGGIAQPASAATPSPTPTASIPTTPSAPSPSAAPATTPTAIAPPTSAPLAVSSASPPPPATTPLPLAAGTAVPASAAPATALVVPAIPTATTLAGTIVPDLARGGATAVLQALALAGVRPREAGELPVAKASPTLLHRLDVPIEEVDPIRASIDTATRQPPQTPLEAAVVQVMREQAAETVVKPQSLVDYDVVLGLPLQVQGQPMPARLAVAERQTSGGRATFLRVDAELTHLGPLSVRISGIENGPMAITVLAAGPALAELVAALPDLNESLRALGLTAGVRVADLAEDLGHG